MLEILTWLTAFGLTLAQNVQPSFSDFGFTDFPTDNSQETTPYDGRNLLLTLSSFQ